ncbi:hypothetical protein FOA52_002553 [Chlamydomonas sp. UWO 241]|nr:hypothetical protein FOA52_002553 [Chlamydomonas sp. UWO 241]
MSSHGYQQNQLSLWKYPSMVKVADLMKHAARVLHMAASPDGLSVMSAGADEQLCLWECFGLPAGVGKEAKQEAVTSMQSQHLRSIR